MKPRRSFPHSSQHRPAFTLVEVLLSATITALVASAGAAFISAVSNASGQTRDVRMTKTQGHYALGQIVRTIRESRGIGQVTGNSVTLWVNDANQDDQVNLYETGTIRYDASAKQIVYEYMQPATANAPSPLVLTSDYEDVSRLRPLMSTPEKKSVVWADGVDDATFIGYPNYTETRVIDCRLVFGTAPNDVAFSGSASPWASADYLFKPEAQSPAPLGSTRKVRKAYSRWTGFSDLLPGGGAINEGM